MSNGRERPLCPFHSNLLGRGVSSRQYPSYYCMSMTATVCFLQMFFACVIMRHYSAALPYDKCLAGACTSDATVIGSTANAWFLVTAERQYLSI